MNQVCRRREEEEEKLEIVWRRVEILSPVGRAKKMDLVGPGLPAGVRAQKKWNEKVELALKIVKTLTSLVHAAPCHPMRDPSRTDLLFAGYRSQPLNAIQSHSLLHCPSQSGFSSKMYRLISFFRVILLPSSHPSPKSRPIRNCTPKRSSGSVCKNQPV